MMKVSSQIDILANFTDELSESPTVRSCGSTLFWRDRDQAKRRYVNESATRSTILQTMSTTPPTPTPDHWELIRDAVLGVKKHTTRGYAQAETDLAEKLSMIWY